MSDKPSPSQQNESPTNNKGKFPKHKAYLEKTFLEELAFKIWATRGARNIANRRLLCKNNLSNRAIAFLTAYLIILGLLSVYRIGNNGVLNDNIIAFGSTTLSILLLTFSQIEASQDYKLRARDFHECSLKLSAIHNEIRIFKTLKDRTGEEKIEYANKMSVEYQDALSHYPNHDPIDYEKFKTYYADYFELSTFQVLYIHLKYYFQTKLLYHFLILSPLIVFACIYFKTIHNTINE